MFAWMCTYEYIHGQLIDFGGKEPFSCAGTNMLIPLSALDVLPLPAQSSVSFLFFSYMFRVLVKTSTACLYACLCMLLSVSACACEISITHKSSLPSSRRVFHYQRSHDRDLFFSYTEQLRAYVRCASAHTCVCRGPCLRLAPAVAQQREVIVVSWSKGK